jgi:hypothetical protein
MALRRKTEKLPKMLKYAKQTRYDDARAKNHVRGDEMQKRAAEASRLRVWDG